MLSSLQALTRRDPRIKMLSSVMSRPRLMGLMNCADAFVSLHRAEGFGMLIAEAMALGKPVVVTGYSGNMAFTDTQNACLVDYSLVPVKPGEYPQQKGQHWAEPDVGHAAKLMRRVFEDADLRQRLAVRARADIANRHNYQTVGTWLARHLGRSGATSPPAKAPLPANLEAGL
jgi:glycosyltransferase involved in cell wall biosynthesis